jgi:hypothetical protein
MKIYEVILFQLDAEYDDRFLDDNRSDPGELMICREVLYDRKIFKTLKDAYRHLLEIDIMSIYKEVEQEDYKEHILFSQYNRPLITTVLLDEIDTDENSITNIINFHVDSNFVELDDFFLKFEVEEKYKKLLKHLTQTYISFSRELPIELIKNVGKFLFSKKKSRRSNRSRRSNNKRH